MAWSAEILMGPIEAECGGSWFLIKTQGDTGVDALHGVTEVFALLTAGKEHLIRAEPKATSQMNFETDKEEHLGYARGVVWNRPGEGKKRTAIEYVTYLTDLNTGGQG